MPTIYDPALAESSVRPGTTGAPGVEAALALFDAQWATTLVWDRNHTPQNVSPFFASFSPQDFLQETGQFQTSVTKTSATGATYSVTNTIGYDMDNSTRAFPADWTANVQVQVSQPLLQGAGVEFNRIAGPGATPGINNGVVLARLNTDIALADFETAVRNLVYDVERSYWELYFAYRNLDAAKAGRNSALETWRRIHALYVVGAAGGEADKEAQAREQYFLFRSTVETALKSLYEAEASLRYIMGLAATDGRLIKPADEPTTAKVAFDWTETHTEALCRSVELRRQRWRVKQRELELIAAKNYLHAAAGRSWPSTPGAAWARTRSLATGDATIDSAFQSMFHGDYQSWELGFKANVPLGFRKEMSNVRNAQLTVAREQAKLQDEELEVSHQVAFAIRDMESNLDAGRDQFQPPHGGPARGGGGAGRLRHGQDHPGRALAGAADAGRRREQLLSDAGQLQRVDRRGPPTQGFLVGVQWRLLGGGALAGEGVFRRPPPRPGPRRRPLPELWIHPAGGDQPRAGQPMGRLRRPTAGPARRGRQAPPPAEPGQPETSRAAARRRRPPAPADADRR